MKRDNRVVIGVMFAVIVVVTIVLGSLSLEKREEGFSQEYIMAEELAPLLSFTYYDEGEWETVISELAKGKVSYKEMEALLEYMGMESYITYEKKAGFQKVPRTVFFQVYEQLVDILDGEERVTKKERVFIGQQAKDGTWLTQKGYEQVIGGLSYIQQYDMYRVYMVDDKIVGLKEVADTPVKWENVFVHYTKGTQAEVLFEKELLTIDLPDATEKISDTICDIEWENGMVSAFYKKEDAISGTVLSYDDKKIEIAGFGTLEHSGNLKIYKTYGTVEQLDESKLVIGNLVADFVVAKGEVCGIILKEPAQIERIRVLLLNGETPYYTDVLVKADEAGTVTFGEQTQNISADTVVRASDYWKESTEGYLAVNTVTEAGNVFLVDESGEAMSLGYQGKLEIRKYEQGYCIVNELSLEEYLCAVVPSEMPASYEIEALRAQAVCARSYACIQLTKDQYAGFGANVDDSTNYQVYNKQPKDEKSTRAVQDTVGEVLFYNEKIAEAYYYSTSCGFSQSMDVWGMADEEAYGYLQSVSLLTGADGQELTEESGLNFSDEAVFAEFIQNKDIMAYDSFGDYFRWRAELDFKDNWEAICAAITSRRSVNSDNVLFFDKEGNVTEKNLSELGAMEQLIVEERSRGGVLTKLRIQCEKGSILLITEYNIRKVLGEAVTLMTDKNENAITAMTLLPSAAFTAIPVENGFVLYGGGYGHGIGLSQNGANGMAKAGFTYTDILQKFYQNIRIENIYNSKDGI